MKAVFYFTIVDRSDLFYPLKCTRRHSWILVNKCFLILFFLFAVTALESPDFAFQSKTSAPL